MKRTALLALVILALPACAPEPAAYRALDGAAASATRLRFTQVSDIGVIAQPPVLDIPATDAAKVSALFEATLALPTVPSDEMVECLFYGYVYDVAFTSGSTTTTFQIVPSGNCQWITLLGATDTPPLVPDADYWSQLASTIGVPETTIYPSFASPPE